MGKIETLWKKMNKELSKMDPHGDWPCKTIVMTEPWTLRVVSNHEGFEEHESFMAFVRQNAIRKEDFNESSLPLDLRDFVKKYDDDDEYYPNIVEAIASGDTLEEAIEDMCKKLRLLDYGYILMDDYFYRNNILDRNNGGWMIDDDGDDDFWDVEEDEEEE